MKKAFLPLILMAGLGTSGCSTLNSLIEKPDDEKTVEEFYADATFGFEEQQWDIAIENYEKLKAYFPYGEYAEQSHLELAYAYYRYDEPESAILELEEFIRLYPKHESLAYAYYLKALAADSIIRSWLDNFVTDPATRDVKSARRAFNYYLEVTQRFPESQYAVAASKRLVILRNQMARHEFKVAEFYYAQEAYLASVNRLRYLLENYEQSSSTFKALLLLSDAYGKMGMSDVQADILKVYEMNKGAENDAIDVSFGTRKDGTKQTRANEDDASWWSNIENALRSIWE